LLRTDNVLNLQGLQKQNWPYLLIWVIYYAWVIVFATWWTASPLTENVFGTEIRSLLHSVNLLASAVFIFIMKKEWYVKTARIGAILIIAGIGLFMVATDPYMQLFAALVIGIALGCVNTSILMPFVFTLNNTEKLYAVVGSNIFINLLLILFEGSSAGNSHSLRSMLLSAVILLIALSATWFFQSSSIVGNEKVDLKQALPLKIYWTLFFSCAFAVICKGAGKGILNLTVANSDAQVLLWYYLGGLAGCFIYLCSFALTVNSIHLAWNIAFGSLAMGLLCNAFIPQIPWFAVVFAVLLGISNTVGMINVYYILGYVGNKYNSMSYLRWSILLIGICGGVSGVVVGNLINRINTFEISIAASVISAGIVIFFLIMSPLLAQTFNGNAAVKIPEKNTADNQILQIFAQYQLSKREAEVCKLLLQGYTLRQISVLLSIGYSTVNTYCTSLYRKLSINSRPELLILFKDYPAE